MTDIVWVVSSSVMILVVIAVRAIFKKRMSAGLRYALWAFVLIRLLIPGTVFSSPISVRSAVDESNIGGMIEEANAVRDYPMNTIRSNASDGLDLYGWKAVDEIGRPIGQPELIIKDYTSERFSQIKRASRIIEALNIVWYCGIALTAAYFFILNLTFCIRIRKRRVRLEVSGAPCPVYSVDGIPSSCLFLNSVYLSKETAENENDLKYVLAHELAHRRHFDAVFALVRCAILALHWYNPIVWLAAFLSARDSEIFADAGAIKELGEDERENYGITLITLSSKFKRRTSIGVAATTMTGGKRTLKERIKHMANTKRMGLLLAATVILIAATALGCAFLGNNNEGSVPDAEPTAAGTALPSESPKSTPDASAEPDQNRFKDEAWTLIEKIGEIYGIAFNRDDSEVMTISNDPDYVGVRNFNESSGMAVTVTFRNGETGMNHCWLDPGTPPENIDMEKRENDYIKFYPYSVTLTEAELTDAGYETDGADGGTDSAARFVANHIAGLFTGCANDNYFRCSDAAAVSVERLNGEACTYEAIIALLPNDYGCWGAAYGDIMGSLCAEPDHYGYLTIWMHIDVVVNEDGSLTATVNFDE